LVETVFVDGTNHVLGRLASYVAKMAIEGKQVIILNCENIALTGKPQHVVDVYSEKIRRIRGRQKGPFWPRRPDNFVRRAIKGMLAHKKSKGTEAFKRVEVYMGVPADYHNAKMITIEKAKIKPGKNFIHVGEFSERLGSVGWR
jgi:large subunit ribosomal protein L13